VWSDEERKARSWLGRASWTGKEPVAPKEATGSPQRG
jgi:hypothetical protein